MLPTRNYTVEGMTCGHCRKSVIEEVLQVDGVKGVDVDLDSGRAHRRGRELRGRRDRQAPSTRRATRSSHERGRARRGVRRAARRDLRARRARRPRARSRHGEAADRARRTRPPRDGARRSARRRRAHGRPATALRLARRRAPTTLHARPPRRALTFRDRRPARRDACATSRPSRRRRMHLIVVRRDLRRFQHLHPVQARRRRLDDRRSRCPTPASTARSRTSAPTASATRSASTCSPPGASSRSRCRRRAHVAHDRRLRRARCATTAAGLRFTRRPRRQLRSDLQPYLGARGHLVVLRAGDLAYEHVHPVTGARPAFDTGELARPARYRLFLQFRHARPRPHGRVHARGGAMSTATGRSASNCRSAA